MGPLIGSPASAENGRSKGATFDSVIRGALSLIFRNYQQAMLEVLRHDFLGQSRRADNSSSS